MQQTIRTQARKELLVLVNAMFLITAFFSALGILVFQKILPQFMIEIGQIERSLTSYFLQGISFALTMAIYLRLLTHKAFCLKTRSKIGLWLLVACLLSPLVTEPLYAYGNKDNFMYFSMIEAAEFLIYMIGLIMFIGGCDIDRKLRRFIKWTPVILMLVSYIPAACKIFKYENGFLLNNIIYTTAQILICLIIYRMSRKEMITE